MENITHEELPPLVCEAEDGTRMEVQVCVQTLRVREHSGQVVEQRQVLFSLNGEPLTLDGPPENPRRLVTPSGASLRPMP